MEIEKYTKEEALEWLRDIGLALHGTKDELINRIKKYIRYPKLVARLRGRAKKCYTFKCSLDPLTIPPPNANWKLNDKLLPKLSQEIFIKYSSQKKEGSQGQQEKAFRMLQSRKIVSVKTLNNEVDSELYVKAMIKKSYGHDARPAVILFHGDMPIKSHCNCPVGASGLCCHVFALLLYLKHFTDTGEKILELTCTQQLQKWHRRITKGSIPMIPLNRIKVKSASRKKSGKNFAIAAADPDKSYFKRDVPAIIAKLNEKLDKEKPVTEHFYSILSKSDLGKCTSYGESLCYMFKLNQLGDHQYVSKSVFQTYVLGIDPTKEVQVQKKIDEMNDITVSDEHDITMKNNNGISIDEILSSESIPLILQKSTNVYNKNND